MAAVGAVVAYFLPIMNTQKRDEYFERVTDSPDETMVLGRRIGAALRGGEVVALVGQLGSGKTHLVKGIAAGAGVSDCDEVNSPTFVLINQYEAADGSLDIYHIDAYRLETIADFEMLGFDDMCYGRSVVLIEWADKVAAAIDSVDRITVEMSHESESRRRIRIGNSPDYVLKQL